MERVPLTRWVALAVLLVGAGAARAADPARAAPVRAATPAAAAAGKPTSPTAATKPSTPSKAPPAAAKTPGKPGTKEAAGKDTDKPAAHNAPKIRANSVLKSDKLLPGRADLRSESERKRDAELRAHFSRVAELDAIAAVAVEKGDVSLQEYVDLVRSKELQRHQKVMMALSRTDAQASALATAAGQP